MRKYNVASTPECEQENFRQKIMRAQINRPQEVKEWRIVMIAATTAVYVVRNDIEDKITTQLRKEKKSEGN